MNQQDIDNLHDFDSDVSQTYRETCGCGKVFEVSTQADNEPEYYTDVFIRCDCGKSVKFKLPVN